MQKDERDLLEVLRFELEFLRQGGYGRSPRTAWRPQHIFEDSPTCMNFDYKEDRVPCTECVLMHLAPPESRSKGIPCRHIPFNAAGGTLESLYRDSNQREIEETVEDWLRATIQRLEEERVIARTHGSKKQIPGEARKATPLFQEQNPKCANTTCAITFHWTGGGKFFRFRPNAFSQGFNHSATDSSQGIHGVRHYWLCERCFHRFTLAYERECGVVLKELWPELPAAV